MHQLHSLSPLRRASARLGYAAYRQTSQMLNTTQLRSNPNLGIVKYGRKHSAAAVRQRIRPALAIVRNEAPDGHGLHRMVNDANRVVVNAGRDSEQNHAVLWTEFLVDCFDGSLHGARAGSV